MLLPNLNIPYPMLLAVALMVFMVISLMLVTISSKAIRAAVDRRQKSRRARVEPLMERFLERDEHSGLRSLGMRDRDGYLAPLMVERMNLLRGGDRERIWVLARELGLVEKYLGDLSSRNRWRRARAAERLGYFGGTDEAEPVAVLLEDEDETVRAVAARALARIGSEEAVEALVRSLGIPSELTRLRIAENLDRVGQATVEPLAKLLEGYRESGRGSDSHGPILACQVLGGLRAHEARPALRLAAAEGESPDIRAQATRALGMIGDTEDVPLLLEAAGDQNWPVRVQAAHALGVIGESLTIPTVQKMVGDREWWVRSAAATALANMGRAGEDALVGLIKSSDPYARDRAAATLERRGITRRFVNQLPLENARGQRARDAVASLVEAGITRHLQDLHGHLPEGEERYALGDLMDHRSADSVAEAD